MTARLLVKQWNCGRPETTPRLRNEVRSNRANTGRTFSPRGAADPAAGYRASGLFDRFANDQDRRTGFRNTRGEKRWPPVFERGVGAGRSRRGGREGYNIAA